MEQFIDMGGNELPNHAVGVLGGEDGIGSAVEVKGGLTIQVVRYAFHANAVTAAVNMACTYGAVYVGALQVVS